MSIYLYEVPPRLSSFPFLNSFYFKYASEANEILPTLFIKVIKIIFKKTSKRGNANSSPATTKNIPFHFYHFKNKIRRNSLREFCNIKPWRFRAENVSIFRFNLSFPHTIKYLSFFNYMSFLPSFSIMSDFFFVDCFFFLAESKPK